VAKALKDVPFDTCYSSDLQRAVETAKRVLVHHSGVEIQTQLGMRERYMGSFQGHLWGRRKGHIPEGGEIRGMDEPESSEAVKARAMTWWNETIVGTTASSVLIVSHGAWIRLLVQGLLEDGAVHAPRGVTVGKCLNTGVSIIEIPRERGRGKLLQFGNLAHLREAAVEGNADEKGM